MNKELKVTKSIDIFTSAEEIWEVLTNPKLIAKYLYGTETITDWKEGSPIIFQGDYEGTTYRDKGNVISFVPLEKLKYNYWSGFSGLEDKPENYSEITLNLVQLNSEKIQLSWNQVGFSSEEGLNHTQKGLPNILLQIKEIAENKED